MCSFRISHWNSHWDWDESIKAEKLGIEIFERKNERIYGSLI